jgi:hypothetical protein
MVLHVNFSSSVNINALKDIALCTLDSSGVIVKAKANVLSTAGWSNISTIFISPMPSAAFGELAQVVSQSTPSNHQ